MANDRNKIIFNYDYEDYVTPNSSKGIFENGIKLNTVIFET